MKPKPKRYAAHYWATLHTDKRDQGEITVHITGIGNNAKECRRDALRQLRNFRKHLKISLLTEHRCMADPEQRRQLEGISL